MTEKIKDVAIRYRLNGIILILIGLFMLLWPEPSLKILCVIVGIILIISGALTLIHYYQTKALNPEQKDMVTGIIQLVIGILLIVISRFFVSVFLILAGLVMIVGCIAMFRRAWELRDAKGKDFVFSILIGVLILALGIVMIINPVGTAAFVIQLCGVALMIVGISAAFLRSE